jgi:hypothetical protein
VAEDYERAVQRLALMVFGHCFTHVPAPVLAEQVGGVVHLYLIWS